MDIKEYLTKCKELQKKILDFIENESDIEENFQNLQTFLKDNQIKSNKQSTRTLMHLVSRISNNHYQTPDFMSKIEQILKFFSEEIKNYFSNKEIFHFFKDNKRVLLFLFNEKILNPDDYIQGIITNDKYSKRFYPEYFYKEFKSFFSEEYIKKLKQRCPDIELDTYDERRKVGQNDLEICVLIRNDSIEDFIVYLNKTGPSFKNSTIQSSIYETNPYLLKNQPTLIDYAAFYGSIQIFKYLRLNNIEVKDSIFMYAIHGNNYELIHVIEEIIKNEDNEKILIFFIEAVKCHHNEIARYFDNIIFNGQSTSILGLCSSIFNFMNYSFFPYEIDNEYAFYFLCKYDQVDLVKLVLDDPSYMKGINVNNRIITKKIIFFLITFLTCGFFSNEV